MKISLAKRIGIFVTLWLLAGIISAVFSDITIEAGEDEFTVRLKTFCFTPLIAAYGVAFTLVQGRSETLQEHQSYTAGIGLITLGIYSLHAVATLTRKCRRQFIALTIIQILILTASTSCVLCFFHYLATHGHG